MSDDLEIKADLEVEEGADGQFTTQEAAAILQRERTNRSNRCLQEVNAVLQKHHCRLEAYIVLRAGQVIPQIEVIAE